MNRKACIGLLTAIILFSVCCLTYSYYEFDYTYDAAGNLTQRTYIVNMQLNKERRDSKKDSSNVIVLSDKMKVTIFPNPTKGELKVDISGVENNTPVELSLFNPNGQLLVKKVVEQGLTTFNLFDYTGGWYMLKVQSGVTVMNFKIVKD